MNRNIVSVIGSAGSISKSLRMKVEELAAKLSRVGYDLATGGEDGTMRAVARGHYLAGSCTNLIHIRPNWDHDWQRNPYPASIVDTKLGMMRNHLVVRVADVVIAVAGGAGTLNEISVAWLERKPIASLTGEGGWSERLVGESLDHKISHVIPGFATVDELVSWVQQQRPAGVFTARLNRGLYPLMVPTLHRVRDEDHKACPIHDVHAQFGMSISKPVLEQKLIALNTEVAEWNRQHLSASVALVTFDDGWKEVLALQPVFKVCPHLRAVLFIGENHYIEPLRPLPLQRLYQHVAELAGNASTNAELHKMRAQLKNLPEAEQHRLLDSQGIAKMNDPEWLLTPTDIDKLREAGWVVASHGPCHEDLTTAPQLAELLRKTSEAIETREHLPWLAWPEGRWSPESFQLATQTGFTLQFALQAANHDTPLAGLVMRELWQ